jgi:hypothetical protein
MLLWFASRSRAMSRVISVGCIIVTYMILNLHPTERFHRTVPWICILMSIRLDAESRAVAKASGLESTLTHAEVKYRGE